MTRVLAAAGGGRVRLRTLTMHATDPGGMLETTIGHLIRIVGNGIELFGVLVIVVGIVWSTARFLSRRPSTPTTSTRSE
jgi:hypothetical protein